MYTIKSIIILIFFRSSRLDCVLLYCLADYKRNITCLFLNTWIKGHCIHKFQQYVLQGNYTFIQNILQNFKHYKTCCGYTVYISHYQFKETPLKIVDIEKLIKDGICGFENCVKSENNKTKSYINDTFQDFKGKRNNYTLSPDSQNLNHSNIIPIGHPLPFCYFAKTIMIVKNKCCLLISLSH